MPSFVDPYLYPGTDILINNFNIHNAEDLAQAERRYTWVQRELLESHLVKQTFDMDHLRALHRRLFGDVYPWAGEYRTVNISKGSSSFLAATSFITAETMLKEKIMSSGLLDPGVATDTFVVQASEILSDINYIHPFREGNGRTQRAFIDDIARVSHRSISWRNVSTHDYMLASIRSFNDANGTAFEALFKQMLQPPIDGLSHLDNRIYDVSPTHTAEALDHSHNRVSEKIARKVNDKTRSTANYGSNAPAPPKQERRGRRR
ncbi:Fic/DOC family protein [Arcanobacterium bovis]|uniref:protein adenylyltransferase n=1 Tax=Arcanobacterium bovis TaxID=2529275 RepID=A0A4Q9UYL0_9ACTO|nr:Fic family protein [Arcanobacterium bovis]TBW20760.1 hypothetical protein EZJ44_08225 [Arcanobacterium bovis]